MPDGLRLDAAGRVVQVGRIRNGQLPMTWVLRSANRSVRVEVLAAQR